MLSARVEFGDPVFMHDPYAKRFLLRNPGEAAAEILHCVELGKTLAQRTASVGHRRSGCEVTRLRRAACASGAETLNSVTVSKPWHAASLQGR